MSPRVSDQLSGIVVLVVDDDSDMGYVIAHELSEYGARVLAITGLDGAGCTFIDAPDIILIDIRLREQSGVDLARALRKRGYAGPMIAISGSEEALEPLGGSGLFAACIAKPYDMYWLIATVMDIVMPSALPSTASPGRPDR